jgi:hypothetical protein
MFNDSDSFMSLKGNSKRKEQGSTLWYILCIIEMGCLFPMSLDVGNEVKILLVSEFLTGKNILSNTSLSSLEGYSYIRKYTSMYYTSM